jgi:2-dehydropantoate 2-reductase
MVALQIIGAGAIGSFLAASFEMAGLETEVVVRGKRRAELYANGITIDSGGQRIKATPKVAPAAGASKRPDYAVVCTKSQDLASGLEALAAYSENPPVIVTIQNGVVAPEQVAELFPRATVLACRVHGFFEMDGAIVRHVGVQPSLVFGCWNAHDCNAVESFAAAVDSAGFKHSISQDIRVDLWEKMLLATAIGGVGTALSIPAGQIMRDAVGRDLLAGAMAEIAKLASLRGIGLPKSCVESTLAFVAGFPQDASSSLQRDLEARRPAEYDHLIGDVLRMAAQTGLDVPVHRRIVQLIGQRGLLPVGRWVFAGTDPLTEARGPEMLVSSSRRRQ